MSTPIQSTLFRFVTLRNPQLIEDKETGFISFPEEEKSNSIYFSAIANTNSNMERKAAINNAVTTNSFIPFAKRTDIKKVHTELYDFSSWLMRNKSYLSYESISSNLHNAKELSISEERILWDNLFYQTTQKTSFAIREKLIHLLITNKFLKAFTNFTKGFSSKTASEITFTEADKKDFIRRANASVIIPKEIIISDRKKITLDTLQLPEKSKNYMEAQLKTSLAKDRLQSYKSSLKEIEQAEVSYKKQEQVRYEAKRKAYKANIKQIYEDATPTIVTKTDPTTGLEVKSESYSHVKLPEFEFEKQPEIPRFSNSELEARTTETANIPLFSTNTQELLKSEEFNTFTHFKEATSLLQDRIKETREVIFNNIPNAIEKINIGTTRITKNILDGSPKYSYVGGLTRSIDSSNHSISMGLIIGKPNVHITNASYQLKTSSGAVHTASNIKKITATDTLINILFFTELNGLQLLSSGAATFSGELTLSTGTKLYFNTSLFITKKRGFLERVKYKGAYSGIATTNTTDEDTDSDVTDGHTDTPTKEEKLFGVTQLGIADFRRVEQEVCCYVPGEVSHIENVMAREYKERATRNLSISEQITEKTSEREIENLTDTTSTERNELQSEASSVINKDNSQNFGANAGVTGKFATGSFFANTNFNASSSNASAISNTQAKNYAQEVTERALERIVQKISSKRTSRMLKEYEENNTHGFDNRKGNEHVTGVYRWVDKMYNNKIINYGKRLMYEFSLPEPAKFYIDSSTENQQKENNAKKIIAPTEPKHPSKLSFPRFNKFGEEIGKGIIASSDINEGNYQYLIGIYNIDGKSAPEKYSFVGTTLSKSQKEGDGTQWVNKVSKEEIEVPRGYKAIAAKTTGKYFYTDSATDVKIHVAGREFGVNTKFNEIYPHYLTKVPVSAYMNKTWIANINVVLKCERTEANYEKWQNETYKAILDAYNKQVEEYNDFIRAQDIEKVETKKRREFSSQLNRNIEKRELKRMAIDLITRPYGIRTTGNHYANDSNTELNDNTEALEKHAAVIKFFEQAFDWEIMAYTFYPYFYADKENWQASFKYNEGNDPIFQAFLQSGMAKSVVPVKPGFEYAVIWFMKTGEIWNGQSMVPDMDDDLYVSIAEEMKTVEGQVEDSWETRVPTTLTVLQAKSVALNEEGLPCNPDCKSKGLFAPSTHKIGGSLEGVDYDIIGQTNTIA
ncbi:hypothetical protein [Tenacibaculum maritimum]|uniref:hypothetical protein n=1 Tax=Tenacibaculum maritimum TaxID=107401 RepID=UPI0038767C35